MTLIMMIFQQCCESKKSNHTADQLKGESEQVQKMMLVMMMMVVIVSRFKP